MNMAYERVSTIKQDEKRQEIKLDLYKIDRRYIDKVTGENVNQPALNRLMLEAKEHDKIYVESISRLGINVDDLRELCRYFKDKGATYTSLRKDSLQTVTCISLCSQ